eukprot:12828861-Alexandrium_andersonii.AAC.1
MDAPGAPLAAPAGPMIGAAGLSLSGSPPAAGGAALPPLLEGRANAAGPAAAAPDRPGDAG